MATTTKAAPLQNIYYKRPAATPKGCLVCYKPTNTVLWNPAPDFFYTCDAHLNDPGFATLVIPPEAPEAKKFVLSEEELTKMKQEWEEKQKKKDEKAKGKDKDKDKDKDKEEVKDDAKNKEKKEKPTVSSQPSATPSPQNSPTPTHQKYVLNRQIFGARVSEQKRRRQTTQAKEVAPKFPAVPKGL